MTSTKKVTFYGIIVWFLAVLFFFYEFFLRVLPATVAKDIVYGMSISVEQFAFIGSAYYFTYSLMQFPVGILLDKFSARLWITLAVLTCAFGAVWFSFAHAFTTAFIARLFIGFGSSFGFISLTLSALNWFPKKYFAFLVGCGQFLGALGPMCAGAPIALMMQRTDGNWREIFLWIALFGVFLAALIAIFFRDKPKSEQKIVFIDRKGPLMKRLAELFKHRQVWSILFYTGTIYASLPLLGAFWGTSYLESRGLPTTQAALIVSMVWLGMAFGSPVFGRISDLIKRRIPIMTLCGILGLVSSSIFLFLPIKNLYLLGLLFFLLGVGGSGQNLAFALITENTPKNLRATALGINNSSLMGSCALIPPFVTSLIRSFSGGGELTTAAFEKGFSVIPVLFGIALLISLFSLKETFCRQQREVHKL